MSNAFERTTTTFENYTRIPVNNFKYLGVDMTLKPRKSSKYKQFAIVLSILIVATLQFIYNFTSNDDNDQRAENIIYNNYYLIGFGKILAIYFNRKSMAKSLEELRVLYPNRQTEMNYNLEHYLKLYVWTEFILWFFFRFMAVLFLIAPLLIAFVDYWKIGVFQPDLPLYVYTFVPLNESILQYLILFILIAMSSLSAGNAITTCDICLFSWISQFCVHFDLLSQQITEIQTDNEEIALRELHAIARQHKMVMKLANEVNKIFGPSIIFSLMSSSFILCFVAYQLLEDVSTFIIFKTLALLMYESKQVVISCYFGNKLMESSSLINKSLYMHNWVEGSVKYQREILFMMMCTSQPFVLNVAGIADITLVTLKEVYSNAYQLFTVFKST